MSSSTYRERYELEEAAFDLVHKAGTTKAKEELLRVYDEINDSDDE